MCMVDSSGIVLQYMVKKESVTKDKIMKDMNKISNMLANKGIYSAIDFKYYNNKIISDTITDNLWYFISSDIIIKHNPEAEYEITDYGIKISNYLLKNFKENETAWNIYNEILDALS